MRSSKKILFAAWACHNENYTSHQAWHIPLSKIFSNIKTFDPQEEIYRYGQEAMNRRFLECIKREQPDYVFLWLIYDEFFIDTLLKIHEVSPKTRTINFFGDDDTLFDSFSQYFANIIDYGLIAQKKYLSEYQKQGIKSVFVTLGVNTDHFRHLKIPKKYDVTFIGTPKRDRYEYIQYLRSNGIKVHVFGAGWEAYPELREVYGGQLSHDEYVRIINESKINLSFTKNYLGNDHYKGRVAEVCACKSFILSEQFSGYLDLFEKSKEITMFQNREELLRKVRYYLQHEREREAIAQRAYKKILKKFTLKSELTKIFREIQKKRILPTHRRLPEISKKIVHLTKNDLRKPERELRSLVEDADYISFKDKKCLVLPHKDYFQMYALEHSDKQISCCDYYVHTPWLGNYLLLQTKYAFRTLPFQQASKLLRPSQLVIRKHHFLKNVSRFRNIFNQTRPAISSEKEILFVSIPLLQIRLLPKLPFQIMDRVFLPKFEDSFRALEYKKKLFTSTYIYKFLLVSLLGKSFLLRRAIQRFMHRLTTTKKTRQ